MESGAFADQPERSHVLVYVVDLSGPAPWNELRMLREELGKYKVGMSRRARMVIESSLTMTYAFLMSMPLKSNLRSVMPESIRSAVVAIVISLEKPANTLLC